MPQDWSKQISAEIEHSLIFFRRIFRDLTAVTVRFVAGLTKIQLPPLARCGTAGRTNDRQRYFDTFAHSSNRLDILKVLTLGIIIRVKRRVEPEQFESALLSWSPNASERYRTVLPSDIV